MSLFSLELLFWFPTACDLFLLVFIYTSCRLKGKEWYFANGSLPDDVKKRVLEDQGAVSPHAQDLIDAVWSLAMAAYSAYACLFPLAVYWCYHHPELRPAYCLAMTILMLLKLESINFSARRTALTDGKNLALLFMYLPTYGTYALVKMWQQ